MYRSARRLHCRCQSRTIRSRRTRPATVPQPNMGNSSRCKPLIRDGKLYISLRTRSIWRWRTILTWRSRAITCPSPTPIFCAPRPADLPRRQHRHRAGHAGRRRRRLWRRRSGSGRGRHHGRRGWRRRRRIRIGAIHAGHRNQRALLRSADHRHWRRRASHPAASQPADQRRAHAAAEYRQRQSQLSAGVSHRAPVITAQFYNNRQTVEQHLHQPLARIERANAISGAAASCWPDSASGPTCASCASRRTTREISDIALQEPDRSPQLPRSRTSTGTWSAPMSRRG